MNKVSPSDLDCDPSTSHGRVGVLVTKAAKIFGIVSRRFDRPSTSDSSLESGRESSLSSITVIQPTLYQQSSTRKLAFGTTSEETDAKSKPMNDFYNNSTLTTVSKMFCAVVLLTAFVLVMTRSLSQFQSNRNSNVNSVNCPNNTLS